MKNKTILLKKETNLLDSFISKYELGQYYDTKDEKYHKMNDAEKAIFYQIMGMRNFAVKTEDEKEKAILASEEDLYPDKYKESKRKT
ncbi:hypothetical protein RWE15_23975 [Virgibacillus halophilus]|uniref:Uncharacterized protein n=1 Tax=Tigheibacillus halophilus TaxID=361280 RepID=A0ABU5CC14_9BACI|nr:hypothetical protein [Virgibacillus halophilus]